MKGKHKFFIPFLSVLFFMVGCTSENSTPETNLKSNYEIDNRVSNNSNYTGEELFRGIFQLEGDIPTKIEVLAATQSSVHRLIKENDAEEQYKAYNDEIVNFIKEENPLLFDDLEHAVNSRDADELNRVMQEVSEFVLAFTLTEALKESAEEIIAEFPSNEYDLTKSSDIDSYISDLQSFLDENPHLAEMPAVKGEENPQRLAIAIGVFLFYAAVVWDVVGVVNYGMLVNLAAAVNAVAAVNAYNALNTETVYNEKIVGQNEGEYMSEKYVIDIFNLNN